MINKKNGFTLIETLVAVLILATAIAGPLTIASKGLSTALVAKDQTTAYYLAQDAVEFVRFARDTNRLLAGNWLSGAGASSPAKAIDLTNCTTANGCYLDSLVNAPAGPAVCASTGCPKMNYDSANGYFNYNGSNPATIFTRTITISTPVSGNAAEAALTVSVSWSDLPGTVHTITVRENLFNWQ